MSIGPAGERLVRISYINVDERAFGRGGPGAVMGSKNLKGIIVKGSGEIPLADPDKVAAIRKAAVADLKTSRANHTKFGTPQYLEVLNALGCMPTRNFQTAHLRGHRQDRRARHEGALLREELRLLPLHRGLRQDVRREGRPLRRRPGPHRVRDRGPARPQLRHLRLRGDREGQPALRRARASTPCPPGNAVALTMELFERGLITKADTVGIDAPLRQPRGAASGSSS